MRRLRVLCLMHDYLVPPEDDSKYDISVPWKTEFDVKNTLQVMGHEVRVVGVADDLAVMRNATREFAPHIVFNLMENFTEVGVFDQNIVSYLELLKVPYTGCNPRGLMLSRDKALSKQLLSYHRIPVPDFTVFRVGRPVQRPKRLTFPLIVKSLTQEASIGISQASVVETDEKLRERVHFIHRSVGTDAIVERYIPGREGREVGGRQQVLGDVRAVERGVGAVVRDGCRRHRRSGRIGHPPCRGSPRVPAATAPARRCRHEPRTRRDTTSGEAADVGDGGRRAAPRGDVGGQSLDAHVEVVVVESIGSESST